MPMSIATLEYGKVIAKIGKAASLMEKMGLPLEAWDAIQDDKDKRRKLVDAWLEIVGMPSSNTEEQTMSEHENPRPLSLSQLARNIISGEHSGVDGGLFQLYDESLAEVVFTLVTEYQHAPEEFAEFAKAGITRLLEIAKDIEYEKLAEAIAHAMVNAGDFWSPEEVLDKKILSLGSSGEQFEALQLIKEKMNGIREKQLEKFA